MSNHQFNIKAHSLQLMLEPSGIIGQDGTIASNLSLDGPGGVRLNLPAKAFPPIKPGVACLVVLSVIQIQPEEQAIVPAASLILPN